MVLGIGTKNKKGGTSSVQADYLIHVLEIKPWPPSQALKSVRSVLLQWEYGDRYSGTFDPVIPSLGSPPPLPPPPPPPGGGGGGGGGGVGDNNNNVGGKIEFNESFRLPVTLTREASVKGVASGVYQRNCLLFNLYEPRRDKTVKGQLLGTVTINLAEFGIVRETVITSASVNCKRSFRNATQPLLLIKIQPFDKHGSSRDSLSEASLDRNDKESVSALMNDEYADEAAEIASFTDDDVSSHSSLTISSLAAFEPTGSSPPQINDHENTLEEEEEEEAVKNSTGESTGVPGSPPLEQVTVKSEVNTVIKHLNGSSSHSSLVDLSLGEESPENDHASLSNFHERSPTLVTRKFATDSVQSPLSSIAYEGTEEDILCSNNTKSAGLDSTHKVQENIVNGGSTSTEEALQSAVENKTNNLVAKVASSYSNLLVSEKSGIVISADSHFNGEDEGKAQAQNRSGPEEAAASTLGLEYGLVEDKDGVKSLKCEENGQKELAEKDKECSVDGEPLPIMGDTLTFSKRGLGVKDNFFTNNRLRHVKSVRSLQDTARGNGTTGNNQLRGEVHEPETFEEAHRGFISFVNGEGKESPIVSSGARSSFSDSKAREYKRRIEKLEGELREAAAIEVALYSIVAEHGSSVNKVHAPARRLSRLYLHALKEGSQVSRASAARSAVSGLVLVAKACGNDVPRLTFWLSNSIVLRAIINLGLGDSQLPISAGPRVGSNGGSKGNDKRSSSLKWKKTSLKKKENNLSFAEDFDDWEDPLAFTSALEKIEAWIFSRIIESIWWQTLTPHMQPASRKANEQKSLKKNYVRKSSLRDEEQANFSLDLWKNAFKDACERLCPVRASGHECGCLPVLARLVMEQCVHRLDVAMFNAILRESADEIPTDPISDPISDSKVLPIPSGKSSFGAGAQLKNVIGNWSRWLTDLFGLDDDDLHQDDNEIDAYDREEPETSSKLFHLLHALSDLMMLPKDMLLNKSIRKEVCPTFGAPLIKRVLHNFVPDEFCPDPIPEFVFETLDTEDFEEAEEEVIRNCPHDATPVVYSSPSAALLVSIIGEDGKVSNLMRRSNSVLRKSYTSDDELDELDSPLTSIIIDSAPSSPIPKLTSKQNGRRDTVRYQLLREVWRDED